MKRALVLAAVVCGGCGGTTMRVVTETVVQAPRACSAISQSGIKLCELPARAFTTAFYATRNGHLVPLPVERPPRAKVGHWATAYLSPDGKTRLAQWSAECEVPIAFFVSARGGRPRVVSGENDWADAPESIAIGWTSDGRALVEFPRAGCGSGLERPGVYAVRLDGTRTFLATAGR